MITRVINFLFVVATLAIVAVVVFHLGAIRPGDLNERWADREAICWWVCGICLGLAAVLSFLVSLYQAGIEEGMRRQASKEDARKRGLTQERQRAVLFAQMEG